MPSEKTEVSELSVLLGIRNIDLAKASVEDLVTAVGPLRAKDIQEKALSYLDYLAGKKPLQRLPYESIIELWHLGYRLGRILGKQAETATWSGPTHSAQGVVIPRDIELENTFVSVKVESNVVFNLSPFALFEDFFSHGVVGSARRRANWFRNLFPELYEKASEAYTKAKGTHASSARNIPERLILFRQVAQESARRFNESWEEGLKNPRRRRILEANLLKFFLRINSAPYYLVALEREGGVIARVPHMTELLQKWRVAEVKASASEKSLQCRVDFAVQLIHRVERIPIVLNYHVEIRWSHGQFVGSPEAKLYKDYSYQVLLKEGLYQPQT